MASALQALGVQSAWVVHGSDGLDELTTVGPSRVSRLDEAGISTFTVDPADLDLPYAHPDAIQGGSPAENVLITRAVLDGAVGATRDIVLLNAAGALVVAGAALDLRQGLEMAAEAIDSGQARLKLSQLIDLTQAAG
jgi:anthranilate phosphoribosyltransferase